MAVIFDFEKLGSLLRSFYAISGVRYTLVDPSYNVIFASGRHSAFCERINQNPEGHARCIGCDAQAAKQLGPGSEPLLYRCHAGAMEVVLPVTDRGQVIAYLFFGQMLPDDQPLEELWRRAREELGWYPEPDGLEQPFLALRRLSRETIQSCAAILDACSSYIGLEGLVQSTNQTDIQRLNAYIDEYYASPITLGDAASALSMSKTKLCGIAAKQQTTFVRMLSARRVEAAKSLLLSTSHTVGQISEMVGVSDYNYFTKLFRSVTGVTPREFRKTGRLPPKGNPSASK